MSGDAAHFTCLKDVPATQHAVDMKRFKDKKTGLLREFEQCDQIFVELKRDFKVFWLPFIMNIKLEIIDVQCDSDLKGKFAKAGLNTFLSVSQYKINSG